MVNDKFNPENVSWDSSIRKRGPRKIECIRVANVRRSSEDGALHETDQATLTISNDAAPLFGVSQGDRYMIAVTAKHIGLKRTRDPNKGYVFTKNGGGGATSVRILFNLPRGRKFELKDYDLDSVEIINDDIFAVRIA